MKGKIISLTFLMLLLGLIIVYTQEASETTILKEQVKCVFLNSDSEQECYTGDGKFSCSGTESCTVQVEGENGKTLDWKSSCGGYAYSVIDGVDDSIEFKCEIPVTTPTPVPECSGNKQCWDNYKSCYYTCSDGKCASLQTVLPLPDYPDCESTIVKEQVKCVFANSASLQKCYTGDGKFGCSGTGTCIADVFGDQGTKLDWKSTCGGYAYTVIDGNNEYAEFNCGQTTTQTPTPVPVFSKEQVKCIFANSAYAQKCYTNDGRFGCSGEGSCTADVSDSSGTKLTWKSSCGGYAYTVIDGNGEYAEFKCEPTATPEIVKQQVKCIFENSNSEQKCYPSNGHAGCSGTGTCVADISGEKGNMITWKSTCGGYAYTVIDGNNEYAEFNCGQTTTQTPTAIVVPTTTTMQTQPTTQE